ncbi:hypothetical protein BCR35DRAFT_78790 [Leucosporidium creatinivorum]|uniref:Uncharacterized protein n=1 Tax=Leucosporidium creatinivorum TaxID=106004 RepID=A0A1Y2FJE6_9BASI|nr:hypothetical protein BCR35DRAFT_78790 [Leucosporidium creatinivorum]
MAVKKKGSTKATTTSNSGSRVKPTPAPPSTTTNTTTANPPSPDVSLGYSVLQLEAMLANYNLDAHSTLLALRRSQQLRLLQIQRHWATALSSLDPQIQELSLGRFLGEFEGDRDKALRGVVGGMLRDKQPPMGQVEQSARKRGRFTRSGSGERCSAAEVGRAEGSRGEVRGG